MKKILGIIFIGLLCFTGCEKVETEKGNYKEGTYFGSVNSESYGKVYTTTATVFISQNGMIKSVFIDTTYIKDDIITTKKTLKDDYAMKETSASIGNIEGGAEWYEQVETLENKIVEEQGTDWVQYKEDQSTLDGISGVTIKASEFIEAVDIALKQAK